MKTETSTMPKETHTEVLDKAHTWPQCIIMACGLSLCITVDILQYSMPLAFLPSVLEDRGHSTIRIATAVGVYYYTGFGGGLMITSYKVWQVLSGAVGEERPTVPTVKRQIQYLIIGLGIGSITLVCQAVSPNYWVHLSCRFIQGLSGAFLFFYTFLLSATLFTDAQQVFAMTAASIALNVAEVMGSFIGAILFDSIGQRSVFWFLGLMSVINQMVLVYVMFLLKPCPEAPPTPVQTMIEDTEERRQKGRARIKELLGSPRLICSVVLIVTAALVKGSVEEMLPFHADHQWGYEPLRIGRLFSVIAVSYILSAIICGRMWTLLQDYKIVFAATWLSALGIAGWCVFIIASYEKSEPVLWAGLVIYGVCLGLTHTPAALLLADVIDHEKDQCSKDAVNGIWNTMWEFGGSVGFLMGGLLAERYQEQIELMTGYGVICVLAAFAMIAINSWLPWPAIHGTFTPRKGDLSSAFGLPSLKNYGSNP